MRYLNETEFYTVNFDEHSVIWITPALGSTFEMLLPQAYAQLQGYKKVILPFSLGDIVLTLEGGKIVTQTPEAPQLNQKFLDKFNANPKIVERLPTRRLQYYARRKQGERINTDEYTYYWSIETYAGQINHSEYTSYFRYARASKLFNTRLEAQAWIDEQ